MVEKLMVIGTILLTVGGLSTIVPDLGGLADAIATEFRDNPIGASAIVVGVLIIAFALRDQLLALFGLYTDRRLGTAIKESLALRHGYRLESHEIDSDKFSIVASYGGRTIQIEKNKDEPRILLANGIRMVGRGQELILNTPEPERGELISDLTTDIVVSLTPIGVQLGMKREEGEYRIKLVHDVIMNRRTFDEYALLQGIGVVFRANATANAVITRWASRHRISE